MNPFKQAHREMIGRFWKAIDRRKEVVLKLAVALGLITIVFHFVDFQKLLHSFLRMNLFYIPPMIAVFYASRALMAYKWNYLLRALEIHVPFGILFQFYVVAPTVGNFISGVGSELFRAYGVSKDRADVKAVLASIAMERALGLFAMLILVLIGIGLALYLPTLRLAVLSHLWWIFVLGCLMFVVILLIFFLWFMSPLETTNSCISKLFIARQLHQIFVMTRQYRYHYRTVLLVFLWTLLQQLFPIGMNYLLVLCLNVHVSIPELIAIVPIIVLAIRLPISFNGIGVQEGVAVALFSLVGVAPADALLMSMVGRVVELFSTLPLGIHYLVATRRSPSPS
jgi:uncharacterized protein (TIRG00374 family)